MLRIKQEIREEKLNRQIRNLTGALDYAPSLESVRRRRAELEAQLQDMSVEKKLALVPWEETAREANANVETIDEMINEAKTELAELLSSRATFVREAKNAENQIKGGQSLIAPGPLADA